MGDPSLRLRCGRLGVCRIVVMVLTRTLARDNRLLRKAGTEPEVIAFVLPDQRHINMLNLVVTNVGRGAARNVRLQFVGDLDLLRKRGARLLSRASLLILPWLPQDERFVQIFGNSLDLFAESPPTEFTIRVHFDDMAGKGRTTESRINIAEFEGLSRLHSPDHEMAEALKGIAKSIGAWNGMSRLKVETVTAFEVAAQHEANYKAIMRRLSEKRESET